MKNLKNFLGSFIIFLAASCSTSSYELSPPTGEECIILTDSALCIKNKKQTIKKLDKIYGYSAIPNEYRKNLEEFMIKTLDELMCYRSGRRKC